MEVIERQIEYRSRKDIFRIFPIGDIHAGVIHCAENDIKRMVDQIKQERNAYWIGMGDMADCILKNDVRFDIQALAPWVRKDNIVESQRNWLKELFKPIAHKCLAFMEGNHCETIHRHYQFDMTRNLAHDLGVPYGGASCFIVPKFARKPEGAEYKTNIRQYVIHAWHGNGGAQTEGARLMRLMRLVNDIQADIYLMGHLHCITLYTPDRLIYQNGRVKSTRLVAATTGSWLKTYTQPKSGEEFNASYAEAKGYKPSRIGCPVLKIVPDHNIFTVEA